MSVFTEPFCSNYQSIRLQSANLNWTPARIIEDKVPFSVRNGSLFANRLAHAYQACISALDEPQQTYHVAEWGAGLGLLSYHFLEQLQKLNPVLYHQTHLHVTEHSQKIITTIQDSGLFSNHPNVSFKVVDALNIHWPDKTPIHFCFSSYLIDTFEAIQLAYDHGKITEIKVQTTFNPDIPILDATQFPPTVTTLGQIYDEIRNGGCPNSQAILQLTENLTETYKNFPLNPEISPPGRGVSQTADGEGPFTINYPLKLKDHLTQVKSHLAKGGVYLLSDFGVITPHDLTAESLVAIYRQSVFYAVWFGAILTHAKENNLDTWCTQNAEYHTQECLLKNGIFTEPELQVFATQFKDVGYEAISNAIDTISLLIPNQDYPQTITDIVSTLSPLEAEDYFLNVTIATQLVDDGKLDEAKKYAQKTIDLYKNAASEAHRLLGLIEHQKTNGVRSKYHFKQALIYLPEDTITHALLGMEEMVRHQFQEAIHHFKKAIQKAAKTS